MASIYNRIKFSFINLAKTTTISSSNIHTSYGAEFSPYPELPYVDTRSVDTNTSSITFDRGAGAAGVKMDFVSLHRFNTTSMKVQSSTVSNFASFEHNNTISGITKDPLNGRYNMVFAPTAGYTARYIRVVFESGSPIVDESAMVGIGVPKTYWILGGVFMGNWDNPPDNWQWNVTLESLRPHITLTGTDGAIERIIPNDRYRARIAGNRVAKSHPYTTLAGDQLERYMLWDQRSREAPEFLVYLSTGASTEKAGLVYIMRNENDRSIWERRTHKRAVSDFAYVETI